MPILKHEVEVKMYGDPAQWGSGVSGRDNSKTQPANHTAKLHRGQRNLEGCLTYSVVRSLNKRTTNCKRDSHIESSYIIQYVGI